MRRPYDYDKGLLRGLLSSSSHNDGIGFDVIGFVLQVFLVSNYMFVIISLPDARGVTFLVDAI